MVNSLGQARARPPDSDWLKLSYLTLVRFLGTGKNRTMRNSYYGGAFLCNYNFKRNISKEIE